MNAKTRTRADKLRERRSLCWAFLLISAFFLYILPKDLLMDTLAFLRAHGLERGLRFLWLHSRGQVIGFLIFVGLGLLFLSCLLGIPSLTFRIRREREKAPANIPAQPAVKEKGGVPMNNKNNKQPLGKGGMAIVGGIVAAIMVFAVANDEEAIIPAIGTMVIVTLVMLISNAANRKKGGGQKASVKKEPSVELHRPFPEPKGKAAGLFHHKDEQESEEVVSCHHSKGKEKYIEQLDSYLKAGLIDKAEYRLMKERYSKLEIPEDYH